MSIQTNSTGIIQVNASLNKLLEPSGVFGQSLQIHKLEVGNVSGADAEISWGQGISNGILKGSLVGGVFVDESAKDSFVVDTSLLIASPIKLNGLELEVLTVALAAGTVKYYNGSSLADYTLANSISLDMTALGTAQLLNSLSPADEAKVSTNALGLPENYYVYVIEGVDGAEVGDVVGIQLLDKVTVVASGNSVVNCYSAGKKIANLGDVYVYISQVNALNFANIEYSQST